MMLESGQTVLNLKVFSIKYLHNFYRHKSNYLSIFYNIKRCEIINFKEVIIKKIKFKGGYEVVLVDVFVVFVVVEFEYSSTFHKLIPGSECAKVNLVAL